MTDDVIAEVATWFRSRGIELAVTDEGLTCWASIAPIGDPTSIAARYGRGDTAEAAVLRARERYEQEQ